MTQSGYVFPGRDIYTWGGAEGSLARMRAAARNTARAAAESLAGWRLGGGRVGRPAAGWAVYCAGCGGGAYASVGRIVEAVTASEIDPELALAIVLRHSCIIDLAPQVRVGSRHRHRARARGQTVRGPTRPAAGHHLN